MTTTTVTDAITADNFDAVAQALYAEIQQGNSVTFTVTPNAPALFAVPDAPQPTEDIPTLGKGILLRSAARLCLRWERGYLKHIVEDTLSEADVLSFLHQRPDFAESCDFANRNTDISIMTRTPVSVAHYAFTRTNGRSSAEEYLAPLASGAGLALNSPALTLRSKLQNYQRKNPTRKILNETLLTMLVHTYSLHVKGKSVSKLRFPTDWSTPPIPRIG